jgi:hypothetical protein
MLRAWLAINFTEDIALCDITEDGRNAAETCRQKSLNSVSLTIVVMSHNGMASVKLTAVRVPNVTTA